MNAPMIPVGTMPPGYRPRVIVRFEKDARVERRGTEIPLEQLGDLRALRQSFKTRILQVPLINSVDPGAVKGLLTTARRGGRSLSSGDFSRFRVLEGPQDMRQLAELADAVGKWDGVENAYVEPPSENPALPPQPQDDPYWSKQGHCDNGPTGIGVTAAWALAGGAGSQQNFIDLERGWNLQHEDLKDKQPQHLWGDNEPASHDHGTRTLGVICAVDNKKGNIGIAPQVANVGVVSYYNESRFDAILRAVLDLHKTRGILLLEAQLQEWPGGPEDAIPIEALDLEFFAIEFATAVGVVVVEAAGNGKVDLDKLNSNGQYILSRNKPGARDSGAIIVGGGTEGSSHSRWTDSNFGSRVDCYAWAESVATTASQGLNPTKSYTVNYGGTSSASAIIAGAALCLQGISLAHTNTRLDSFEMRTLLSNTALGTPSADPVNDRIGVMPDLAKAVPKLLGDTPPIARRLEAES